MAMADLGFEPAAPDRINELYGEPLEIFCQKLLGCDEITCRAFRDGIRKHQNTYLPEKGELYSGTLEMLQELTNMGFNLAVCSNAGSDYIELVLSSLGISGFFSILQGRDGYASKTRRIKRIINRTDSSFTVMTGDRYHDIEAARENAIPSIGCLYGYGKPEEMRKADYTVSRPSEIVEVMKIIMETIQGTRF